VRRAATLGAILAAGAAGCGSDDSEQPSNQTDPAKKTEPAKRAQPAKKPAKLTIADSQFGRILADRRGQALYLFAKEKSGKSECYGACAKAWPPLLSDDGPAATDGVRKDLLGTTKRRDGRLQATYRGQPVYLYVDDSPGKVLCHNVSEFGGLWLVIRPNGRPAPA
jgi:predicted lipoprotein with Yx(FWY)xxD motif